MIPLLLDQHLKEVLCGIVLQLCQQSEKLCFLVERLESLFPFYSIISYCLDQQMLNLLTVSRVHPFSSISLPEASPNDMAFSIPWTN
jgi:hypothetical protein